MKLLHLTAYILLLIAFFLTNILEQIPYHEVKNIAAIVMTIFTTISELILVYIFNIMHMVSIEAPELEAELSKPMIRESFSKNPLAESKSSIGSKSNVERLYVSEKSEKPESSRPHSLSMQSDRMESMDLVTTEVENSPMN